MTVFISKMNWWREHPFRISPAFFAWIQPPSPKKFGLTVWLTGIIKAPFIMHIISAYTVFTVRKLMLAARSFNVAFHVPFVQPVTRPAKTLIRSSVRLQKAPYVCNGCNKKIHLCTIAHKYHYDARFADRKYREKLRDSRAGINLTKRQLHQKDQISSPLIEQGQSPYHILTNHPELDMSVRTLYSYLDQGLFTARNIDLKRKTRFKPRKCHKTQIMNRTVFTNRLYSDFRSLDLPSYVEMDTVHSSRESKKKPPYSVFY